MYFLSNFFGSVVKVTTGILVAAGLFHSTITADTSTLGIQGTTSAQVATTQPSISELQHEIELLKNSRAVKTTGSVLDTVSVPSTNTNTNTYVMPSGTIVDSSGNIINPPQNNAPQQSAVGQNILTAAQIANMAKPSIAEVTTLDGNSAGSGFVIAGGKYLITNQHVVGSNIMMKVILPSGTYTEPVIGKNSSVDLALIYVGDHTPRGLVLGSSDENSLPAGDNVYALGFPLSITEGLTQLTLTRGILSARQKTAFASEELLQTDAAINHGNSGGPLLNDRGEVIGINTFTDAGNTSAQTQGIYFAIPIDTAKAYIPSLSDNGQSRYELYPLGSTRNIPASVLNRMELNPKISCSQLAFMPTEESVCEFYRNYGSQYVWNIVQGQ